MKKEKVELSTGEAVAKAFEVSLNCIEESDKLYMEHLKIKANFLEKQIKSKYEEEPSKFFKKTYKKWQTELEELESKLMDVYNKVGEEISSKEAFYEKLKSN